MKSNKKRAEEVFEILKTLYPDAACSLKFDGDPFKLLIMARLSAQCTDYRVNIVSEQLFSKYDSPEKLANAPLPEIEQIIRPCGLFRVKAESIKKISRIIYEDFGSSVPSDMDMLLSLPGVGRKIANLIRGDVFGIGGIVADTHCIRISNRLGFTLSKNPVIVERDLSKIVPPDAQTTYCHLMVYFGRDICKAQNPSCDSCRLKKCGLCNYKK